MKFLQRTPFFRLLFAVVVGIILYQYWKFPAWVLAVSLLLSLVLISGSFLIRNSHTQYRFRWLFGCGIIVLFTTFSYGVCAIKEKQNNFAHADKEGIFLVELTQSPLEKERSYLFEVKIIQYTDSFSTFPSMGKAYMYLQKDSTVSALSSGDRLLVSTEFNTPESMDNPDGFDYAAYLKRKGIGGTSYVSTDKWIKAGKRDKLSVLLLAHKCREYFLNIYRTFDFRKEDFAVLAALTFGYTDELEPDLRASYSASGAMHILAVSGLHVGIIYAILAFLSGFLNNNLQQRKLRTILILIFLWIYAFITGLPPSVFRATLMFSFAAIGSIFERKSLTYNTIFMSAFLMLLIEPDLLFNVGFRLSYAAVLSIIYFQPKISKLIYFRSRVASRLWDLASVSIAAQIGTLPFTLYYFQVFPNYFLLTNMIAIPAATLILYLAGMLLIFSYIPVLSVIIAFLLKVILRTLNISVVFIQNLPYSVSTIAVNELQIILIVLSIIFFGYYFHSKKFYALTSALSCCLIVFTISTYIKYQALNMQRIIVYTSNRHTHVNFIDRNTNFAYSTDEDELKKIASSFWNNKKLKHAEIINKNNFHTDGYIFFKGLRILILEDDFSRSYTATEPIKVDYLIIGHGLKPRMKQLLECVDPQNIIADKTVSPWYTNHIKESCEEKGINFHSTRLHETFVKEINNKPLQTSP